MNSYWHNLASPGEDVKRITPPYLSQFLNQLTVDGLQLNANTLSLSWDELGLSNIKGTRAMGKSGRGFMPDSQVWGQGHFHHQQTTDKLTVTPRVEHQFPDVVAPFSTQKSQYLSQHKSQHKSEQAHSGNETQQTTQETQSEYVQTQINDGEKALGGGAYDRSAQIRADFQKRAIREQSQVTDNQWQTSGRYVQKERYSQISPTLTIRDMRYAWGRQTHDDTQASLQALPALKKAESALIERLQSRQALLDAKSTIKRVNNASGTSHTNHIVNVKVGEAADEKGLGLAGASLKKTSPKKVTLGQRSLEEVRTDHTVVDVDVSEDAVDRNLASNITLSSVENTNHVQPIQRSFSKGQVYQGLFQAIHPLLAQALKPKTVRVNSQKPLKGTFEPQALIAAKAQMGSPFEPHIDIDSPSVQSIFSHVVQSIHTRLLTRLEKDGRYRRAGVGSDLPDETFNTYLQGAFKEGLAAPHMAQFDDMQSRQYQYMQVMLGESLLQTGSFDPLAQDVMKGMLIREAPVTGSEGVAFSELMSLPFMSPELEKLTLSKNKVAEAVAHSLLLMKRDKWPFSKPMSLSTWLKRLSLNGKSSLHPQLAMLPSSSLLQGMMSFEEQVDTSRQVLAPKLQYGVDEFNTRHGDLDNTLMTMSSKAAILPHKSELSSHASKADQINANDSHQYVARKIGSHKIDRHKRDSHFEQMAQNRGKTGFIPPNLTTHLNAITKALLLNKMPSTMLTLMQGKGGSLPALLQRARWAEAGIGADIINDGAIDSDVRASIASGRVNDGASDSGPARSEMMNAMVGTGSKVNIGGQLNSANRRRLSSLFHRLPSQDPSFTFHNTGLPATAFYHPAGERLTHDHRRNDNDNSGSDNGDLISSIASLTPELIMPSFYRNQSRIKLAHRQCSSQRHPLTPTRLDFHHNEGISPDGEGADLPAPHFHDVHSPIVQTSDSEPQTFQTPDAHTFDPQGQGVSTQDGVTRVPDWRQTLNTGIQPKVAERLSAYDTRYQPLSSDKTNRDKTNFDRNSVDKKGAYKQASSSQHRHIKMDYPQSHLTLNYRHQSHRQSDHDQQRHLRPSDQYQSQQHHSYQYQSEQQQSRQQQNHQNQNQSQSHQQKKDQQQQVNRRAVQGVSPSHMMRSAVDKSSHLMPKAAEMSSNNQYANIALNRSEPKSTVSLKVGRITYNSPASFQVKKAAAKRPKPKMTLQDYNQRLREER